MTLWSTAAAKHAVNAAISYHFFMILTVLTPIINQRNYKAGKFKVSSWLYLPMDMKT